MPIYYTTPPEELTGLITVKFDIPISRARMVSRYPPAPISPLEVGTIRRMIELLSPNPRPLEGAVLYIMVNGHSGEIRPVSVDRPVCGVMAQYEDDPLTLFTDEEVDIFRTMTASILDA